MWSKTWNRAQHLRLNSKSFLLLQFKFEMGVQSLSFWVSKTNFGIFWFNIYFEHVFHVLVFWNWTNDVILLISKPRCYFENLEVNQIELELFYIFLEISRKFLFSCPLWAIITHSSVLCFTNQRYRSKFHIFVFILTQESLNLHKFWLVKLKEENRDLYC
jgi:hypothetical protein